MPVPATITLGVVGVDGATIAWSREDAQDLTGQGRFAGSPDIVNETIAILSRRDPIVLPTGTHWQFLPFPLLRPVDVAAAMIVALQVEPDLTRLLADHPELSAALQIATGTDVNGSSHV